MADETGLRESDSDSDGDSERLVRGLELTAGFREAAHRALAFARRYRIEEGVAGGSRELACIAQAHVWRRAVHALHAGLPVPGLPGLPGLPALPALGEGPGLARAHPDSAAADRKTG